MRVFCYGVCTRALPGRQGISRGAPTQERPADSSAKRSNGVPPNRVEIWPALQALAGRQLPLAFGSKRAEKVGIHLEAGEVSLKMIKTENATSWDKNIGPHPAAPLPQAGRLLASAFGGLSLSLLCLWPGQAIARGQQANRNCADTCCHIFTFLPQHIRRIQRGQGTRPIPRREP